MMKKMKNALVLSVLIAGAAWTGVTMPQTNMERFTKLKARAKEISNLISTNKQKLLNMCAPTCLKACPPAKWYCSKAERLGCRFACKVAINGAPLAISIALKVAKSLVEKSPTGAKTSKALEVLNLLLSKWKTKTVQAGV